MKRKRADIGTASVPMVNGTGIGNGTRSANKFKKTGKGKKSAKTTDAREGQRAREANAYYVVPWCGGSDWDRVCVNFNKGNQDAVIQEILMWRERVPALPIGAESTLFLLQAIVFDKKTQRKSSWTFSNSHSDESGDDKCRSLYSLAVVRYLNHISHLATREMGDSAPFQMIRLATHLNVPDWIVELRHAVSHGSTLPSLEVLRLAADFMINWLQENYWIELESATLAPADTVTRSGTGADVLKTRTRVPKAADPKTSLSKEEKYMEMTRAISCFVACRIYKLRQVKTITDPEITHHLPKQPQKVIPKLAMGHFKTQLANFFTTDPFLLCTAFAYEIVPSDEFLIDFSALLELPVPGERQFLGSEISNQLLEQLASLWEPLIDLINKRSKVPQMCTLLASMYLSENSTKISKLFSALWLDFFLRKLEEDKKNYPIRLKKILAAVLTAPDPVGTIFFPKLLRLLENNLGPTKIHQLETLFSIWVDDGISANENNVKKGNSQKFRSRGSSKLFTLEQLTSNSNQNSSANEKSSRNNVKPEEVVGINGGNHNPRNPTALPLTIRARPSFTSNWQTDIYSENYWRNIPLGGPA